ncbi:MAG: HoxN/HupN/NixA family nickel/cobalt transporter [Mycobacterium sp.]|nr:HoxN/HupN/NixA family nickel/cobalt transporter [Mycobacterium sp.]
MAGLVQSWTRRDWTQVAGLLGVVGALHLLGFGALVALVTRSDGSGGAQVLSIGVGVAAYLMGLRHAFDADHIAAIDNVTRKLSAERSRPKSVGFWFALGHAAMVVLLALLVGAAARAADVLLNDGSAARRLLGTMGTLVSGGFLYLIAAVNVVVLVGIWQTFLAVRAGRVDDRHVDGMGGSGVLARLLGPVMRRITAPGQMFVVGALFGLGFDTATEVALLAMAGSGAAAGLPWYALLVLPVLFAAGMSLMDTLDGVFMSAAYDWAFADPFRKIFYNFTITALSVAVAGLVGTVQLITVIHDDFGWANPVTDWVSSIGMDQVGFIVVGLVAITWALAAGLWRLGLVPTWQR